MKNITLSADKDLYAEGLRLSERYRLSWCDALIAAAAIEGQCNLLYTEDLQHGQRFEGVRVENPFR